jgi:hypothetical protein
MRETCVGRAVQVAHAVRVERVARAALVACAATVAFLFVSLFVACGGTSGAPPRAPRPRAMMPSELLPEDLDLVVRVDAARIRQNPMLVGIVRDLAKSGTAGILASAKSALDEATAVWVGTRWMSDGFHGDGIVAVDAPPAREPDPLSSPGVKVAERSTSSRSDPALEVVVENRGVVLATAAEADAVLRVLRDGPDEGRLDPPARGLLSFAGRVREGAGPRGLGPFGALRALTEGLVGFAGSLDERDAIEVEASLTYASAEGAARAALAAKRAAERLSAVGGDAQTMADSMKLTEVGASLQLRVSVPFAWLAKLH